MIRKICKDKRLLKIAQLKTKRLIQEKELESRVEKCLSNYRKGVAYHLVEEYDIDAITIAFYNLLETEQELSICLARQRNKEKALISNRTFNNEETDEEDDDEENEETDEEDDDEEND